MPSSANFVPLTAEGFLPLIESELDDYSATFGARGAIAGWKADFSVGRGTNSFDYQLRDTLNTSFGPQSPSDFDAGGLRYGQWLFNADFSRQFEVGLATPLSVAVGAEHRRERSDPAGPGRILRDRPFFRAAVPIRRWRIARRLRTLRLRRRDYLRFPGAAPLARRLSGNSGDRQNQRGPHSWSPMPSSMPIRWRG